MDKHPKPMKDCKPVEMVENAADQYQRIHQDQYEARAKPSRDRVETVHKHNRACPQLLDELQRRRSIARVTTDKAKRFARHNGACENSTSRYQPENKTKARRKNKTLKSSNARRNIKKETQKSKRKNLKSMIGTCPICLVAIRREKKMPLRINRSIHNIFTANGFDKSPSEDEAASLTVVKKERKSRDKVSIASTNYPDTSNQSIVSYHSFASMNKEPMVD